MNIKDFKQKNPAYADMADEELADALHKKYYSDVPKDQFFEKVGVAPAGFTNVLTGNPIETTKKDGYGIGDLAASKMTFGLSDKAVAGARSLVGDKPYGELLAERDADKARYQEENPVKDWGTLPLNFVGGAPAATSLTPVKAGAAAGAQGGALAGFGNSRGDIGQQAIDTAVGGAVGAGVGAGVGYVAPKVVGVVENVVRRVAGKLKGQPPAKAYQILLDTMQQDGIDPAQAAQMLDEARARGVPLSLSDTGDNMRGLTSSLARKPGPSRNIVRDALETRQAGQAERVQGAVQRDLGPTTNVRKTSEQFMADAKAKAAPLYDEAYSAPVSWTNEPGSKINKILSTPAGKAALGKARTIAANEMDDPTALGFNLDKNGEVVLERVPSMKTLDYVKRGLDDVVEQYRDTTTGKLNLDTNGRAINNLRGQLNAELRGMNAKYGEALDAYGGDARMAVALQKGRGFTNKSADDIEAEIERLTAAEAEQYKLGVRSALSDFVEGKPDGGDKVKALIGSPKKRKALASLFGGEKQFNNFLATLGDEGKAFQTYSRSMTGSPTAPNLADDQNLEGLTNLLDAGLNVKNGRVINAARILFGGKSGADKLSESTRTQLAAALTESDPAAIREAIRQASMVGTQTASRNLRGQYIGANAGLGSGNLMSRYLIGE